MALDGKVDRRSRAAVVQNEVTLLGFEISIGLLTARHLKLQEFARKFYIAKPSDKFQWMKC
jgi:hypothetical protein